MKGKIARSIPELGESMQLHSQVDGDQILSALDVAKELRCSKAHIYKVILGKVNGVSAIPIIQLGRRKLVRRSSLEAWKQANETGKEQIQPTETNAA
jgi:hypothetical protein